MKSHLWSLVFIFILVITPVMAYECQDNTEFWNSPCEVVTPILSDGGSCNALILNINNTAINQSVPISDIGDGTYNYTFNYTDIATYSMTLSCSNYSSTINVIFGSEEQEPGFNLWVVIALIFIAMISTGIIYRNYILIFMAGMYPLLMGIWIFKEGITIYGVDNWFVYPLGWIFVCIGLILTLLSSLKYLESSEYGDDEEW